MLKLLNRRSALITTLIFGNQTVNVSLAATRAEFFVVEPHFVRESKPVDDLLHEMRGASMHMAVVVDEYGGLQALLQRKKSLVKSETSETTKGEHSFVLAPLNGGCLPKLNSKYC